MDIKARIAIGLLLVALIQILLGTTTIYLIRRWRRESPQWSWLRSLSRYVVMGILATGVSLIPEIGAIVAAIVVLVALRRFTGMHIFYTFLVAVCLGMSIRVCEGFIGKWLDVNLIDFPQ